MCFVQCAGEDQAMLWTVTWICLHTWRFSCLLLTWSVMQAACTAGAAETYGVSKHGW
jgi:hypothetical protein